MDASEDGGVVDVLVVGAGPTGLALAVQAERHGASVRIVDRAAAPVRESRALVVQPRTLELLAGCGVTDALVERGRSTVRLVLHAGRTAVPIPLFDLGLDDSPYPYLLFLSQAETEAALGAHLAGRGVAVERGAELVGIDQDPRAVRCRLSTAAGEQEVAARFVVGCDGVASTVRESLGVPFVGDRYPHRFALADLDVDGDQRGSLEVGAVHTYLAARGMLFFFPLGRPAPWRLFGILPHRAGDSPPRPPSLVELQALADEFTGGAIRLREPVWRSEFRLRHRLAARYRVGRVFLAGDSAHAHSPAGGQGMNAGIQDAWNLGWKLALAARGVGPPRLLDSYEAERRPVGAALLRYTDRLFSIATSTRVPILTVRTRVVPRVAPLFPRLPAAVRAAGFRRVADLDVRYRRSPVVEDAHSGVRRGPLAGDRLPDAPLTGPTGRTSLHRLVGPAGHHVLLVGSAADAAADVAQSPDLTVHGIRYEPVPGQLQDDTGQVRRRLNAGTAAQYVVRPDGHVAFHAGGEDLRALLSWLRRSKLVDC